MGIGETCVMKPEDLQIHEHRRQKMTDDGADKMTHTAKQMTSILFRCDGSPEIGLGHIVRCLALADELRDAHDCRIAFAMRTGPIGIGMVKEKGYQVILPTENGQAFDYKKWMNECVNNVDPKTIILDVRDGLQRTVVDELRGKGILTVTIDDPEDKRLSADLAFYPPVPQVKRMDWTGFTGKLYVGWEWVILRREFVNAMHFVDKYAKRETRNAKPRILVTMGGSDPHGMTIKTIKALELLDEDFEAVVVSGAGFQHKEELNNLLSGCKHRFDVQENVQNMAKRMAQSDLAVASFGVTAYELAAMGVPAIYLCLTEDHAESASAFAAADMGTYISVPLSIDKKMLADTVKCWLKRLKRRSPVSTFQGIKFDGVTRIARMICEKR